MNGKGNLVAFDIEIARVIPDGVENWDHFRPLGVSCAATLKAGEQPVTWYGGKAAGNFEERMSQVEVQELVVYLRDQVVQGATILTWNGLGFDFDILAEESEMPAECSAMARQHIDMMFHAFCLKGFALGLDKAARGMGLAGKTPGITGDMAPKMWQAGQYEEVLDYVQQDARTLIELWTAVDGQRVLRWTSNRGYPQRLPLPKGWLSVEEALKIPLPDTSWMSDPWPRSKFTGWLV